MKNDNNTMVTESDTQLLKQGINSATIRVHEAAERSWVMVNTLENKAKFFAQYWGQMVMREEMDSHKYFCKPSNEADFELNYLELTPLSKISDEDAIEVAEIRDDWTECPLTAGRATIRSIQNIGWDYVRDVPKMPYIIDYLRSRGYALPWMGLSVETLVEYGWVKIKGGNNG